MLYVTTLDGSQTEPLAHIDDYERVETLNDTLELSFVAFNDDRNPGYALLTEEAVITDDDDREYRVKQIRVTERQKIVYAMSTFFDLEAQRKYDIFGGTKTLAELATWVFDGTGWTAQVDGITHRELVPNFGRDDIVTLTYKLLAAFEADMQILPGNVIRFAARVGESNDKQFRYKYNIVDIENEIDTTDLRTHIEASGNEGLKVTYTSPMADVYGIRHAEPISDERYANRDSLLAYAKRELNDTPNVTVSLDALGSDAQLGESVWLIYEPLGIEQETRVIERRDRKPAALSEVVLGNATRRTFSDITDSTNTRIDETNETIEERTSEYRSKFEQTDQRITMEVENITEEMSTKFEMTAEQIRLEAKAREDQVAALNIRADNINISVSGLTKRMTTAESSINVLNDEIELKVDEDGVIAAINVSPELIKLKASKIELEGITQTAGDLQIGTQGSGVKSLNFYFDYGYQANIRATQGVYGSGLAINSSDLVLGAWDHLTMGTAQTEVTANGDWIFTGTVSGITAVAVLG